jgi:predicted branched-subunit amino acid permease
MPLCYQTFPDTDNSRGWHRGSTLLFFIVWLQRSLLCKILGLDVSYEPGFSNMEFVSRLLFWIIVLAILYSTYKIIFNKNK